MATSQIDHASAPRQSHAKANQHNMVKILIWICTHHIMDGDWDRIRDRIAVILYIVPVVCIKQVTFLLQILKHEMIRLVEYIVVHLIFRYACFLQNILYAGWNYFQGKIHDSRTIHVKVLIGPLVPVFIDDFFD